MAMYAKREMRYRGTFKFTDNIEMVCDLLWHTPDFVPRLIERMSTNNNVEVVQHVDTVPLTEREMDILDRLCKGMEYKEMANDLGISISAVRFHCVNVYKKFGCRNAVEAYTEGMRRGLIDPPRRMDNEG
jgi:DNA-binding CsgD family transcriptional regulator